MKALKTIKIALIILLLYGVNSCTKFGKNFAIEGKVLNPITEEPFEGIEIRIYKKTAFNGGYSVGGGSKTIATTLTDANGYFKLNAGRLSAVYVMIKNNKGNYNLGWYKKGKGLVPESNNQELPRGKTAHWDYYMVPYGKLRMHVQNQNCQGTTDSLDIFFDGSEIVDLTGNQDANNHIGSILYAPITGCWDKIDNGFKTQIGKRYYHWTVTRGGSSQTYYDTVYVEPNQTTTLNVFY